MSTLRDVGARLLGANLLDWLAAGAGTVGIRPTQQRAAIVPPPAEDETGLWHRNDRDREIELRILMSNWM